jgi:hypothetical protein
MRTIIDYPGATLELDLSDTDQSFAPAAAEYRRRHGCERCNHAMAAHLRSGCGVEVDRKKCGCVSGATTRRAA